MRPPANERMLHMMCGQLPALRDQTQCLKKWKERLKFSVFSSPKFAAAQN
jgi:hypothetical protein